MTEPKTKILYVLVQDGGDGSYYPRYTFNKEWIEKQKERSDLDCDSIGCDGDGFHYDKLTVPDSCTLKSLGLNWDCAEEY